MNYHSRSSLETYLSSCQFKYYLNYLKPNGEDQHKGIQTIERSIDLEAGTLAHNIINQVLTAVVNQNNKTDTDYRTDFDYALGVGLDQFDSVTNLLFDRKIDPDNEEFRQRSISEHRELIKALCYLWFKTEFQFILRDYQVISTEKEIESKLNDNDILLSRVDALLFHRETKEYVTWSLKTTKVLGWFTDAMENSDLQGYLEMFAANNYLAEVKQQKQKTLDQAYWLTEKDKNTLEAFLNKKAPEGDSVNSVRFCFLVKGDRKSSKKSPYPVRANSLIYGYRKRNKPIKPVTNKKGQYTEEEIELASKMVPEFSYAHSYEFYNSENASGTGVLGKDWEKFNVWEDYEGGVIQWIDDIAAGIIQPEATSPLEKFISAKVIIRDSLMLNRTVYYIKEVCKEINLKLSRSERGSFFFPNTKSCSIPVTCDYQVACPYSGVGDERFISDPLIENNEGNKLYQIRVPHHPEPIEKTTQLKMWEKERKNL